MSVLMLKSWRLDENVGKDGICTGNCNICIPWYRPDPDIGRQFSVPPVELTKTLSQYKVFESLDIMFGTTSILNLVALALERLLSVALPTWHFNLTWRPVCFALGLSWILGAMFCMMNFLTPNIMDRKTYFYIVFSLSFLLPTVVIVCCYAVIFKVAKTSEAMNSRRVKRDMKIARMILIIIGLFLFCWLPFFTISVIYYNCKSWCGDIPNWVVRVIKPLHYTNSMMNFLVYAARSPDYRRSFSALIRWRLPRFRSDTLNSITMVRRRTLSNGNSKEHIKPNGNVVYNDVRHSIERGNGNTLQTRVSDDSSTADSGRSIH
eukprot:gene5669-6365_t